MVSGARPTATTLALGEPSAVISRRSATISAAPDGAAAATLALAASGRPNQRARNARATSVPATADACVPNKARAARKAAGSLASVTAAANWANRCSAGVDLVAVLVRSDATAWVMDADSERVPEALAEALPPIEAGPNASSPGSSCTNSASTPAKVRSPTAAEVRAAPARAANQGVNTSRRPFGADASSPVSASPAKSIADVPSWVRSTAVDAIAERSRSDRRLCCTTRSIAAAAAWASTAPAERSVWPTPRRGIRPDCERESPRSGRP